MDGKNKADSWQRYLLVGVGVFGIAIAVRLCLLSSGIDAGTANLTFIAIFVFGMAVYWAVSPVLARLLAPLFNKLLSGRNKEVAPALIPLAKRQDALINVSVRQFEDYSKLVLSTHLTPEDLILLDTYIQAYAADLPLNDNIQQLQAKDLKNADLYHYCWNLWYHFGKIKDTKQDDAVYWLKTVFANLNEIGFSTIKGKLTIDEKDHYEIPLCKDISAVIGSE